MILRSVLIGAITLLSMATFVAIPRPVSPNAPDPASDHTISAVSLNLAKETDAEIVLDSIRHAPRLRDADLFLFQEVAGEESTANVAAEAARKLRYFVSFEKAGPGIYDQGLAVVSRYPIRDVRITRLKACDLGSRSRKRFAISGTLETPWGDLRVWNAHLDTRINAQERLQQLQPVLDEAARYDGPRLIGGDFNTNDVYWVKHSVPLPWGPSHGAAIRSAMNGYGFETPFQSRINTFPAFRRHLDWIYVRELRVLKSSVEPTAFSDHNAIWTRLGFAEPGNAPRFNSVPKSS